MFELRNMKSWRKGFAPALILCSCSSSRAIIRVYDGGPRSDANVATVDFGGLTVARIVNADGENLKPSGPSPNWPSTHNADVQFMPGHYELQVAGPPRWRDLEPITFVADLAAGHCYDIVWAGGASGNSHRLVLRDRTSGSYFSRAQRRNAGSKLEFTLPADRRIASATFKAGTAIEFYDYDNSKVREGTLASNATLNKLTYTGGTRISFYETGEVQEGVLASNATLNKLTYKGGTRIRLSYHGAVYEGTLAVETRIGNITIAPDRPVTFGVRETFASGYLGSDTTIDDVVYMRGTKLTLSYGGVLEGTLGSQTNIDNKTFPPGTLVSYGLPRRAVETVDSATIAAPTTFLGVAFDEGNQINFENDGLWLRPVENILVGGIVYKKGKRLELYNDGSVRRGTPISDVTIEGIAYERDWPLSFDKNGKVLFGTLKVDTKIGGVNCKAGNTISFDANGNFIKCQFTRCGEL